MMDCKRECNCRDGPPWPPCLYTTTRGGHGGPPLQYEFESKKRSVTPEGCHGIIRQWHPKRYCGSGFLKNLTPKVTRSSRGFCHRMNATVFVPSTKRKSSSVVML